MSTLQEQLSQLQTRLATYLDAETKILEGDQSWTVGKDQHTRPDLAEVRREIRNIRMEISVIHNRINGAGGPLQHSAVVFPGRR